LTKREVILQIPKGIHLRVAGLLAKKATEFKSEIFIEHQEMSVNCKSVMSIAVLGAMTGDELIVSANGEDENLAILSICSII
jgi:phosphotransferase system HPr (HPr) family protein